MQESNLTEETLLILQMGVRDIDVLTIEVGEFEMERKYKEMMIKLFGH